MGWGGRAQPGQDAYKAPGSIGGQQGGAGYAMPQAPSISFSPSVASYNIGGGNPNSYGAADTAQYDRPFKEEGKLGINLLDPESRGRYRQEAAAAGEVDEGEEGDFFDGPGGFFSGILGAVGGTFGEGGAQVGSNIGKIIEAPLGVIGGLPIPIPFVDEINKGLEGNTPHLVSDIAKVPTNVGGAFMSMLGLISLTGRVVERTFAGTEMRNMVFQPDIQEKVDSGEWDEDTGIDEMVLRGAGFTDNALHNMGLSMILDPVNLLSLGVASAASAAGAAGKLARAGSVAGSLNVKAARAALDAGDGAAIQLRRLARMNLAIWENVPNFESTVVPIANHISRITDPLRMFSGGNIGKRTAEHVNVAITTGMVSAFGVELVHRTGETLEQMLPGSRLKFDKLLGTAGSNYGQQWVANQMGADALQRGAIPHVDGMDGVHLSPQAVASEQLRNGAYDTNIGKHVEVMVESMKPTLAHLTKDEVATQTRQKLVATFGIDEAQAAAIKVDDNMAALVHALYYFGQGVDLNDVVKPVLTKMQKAGQLAERFIPKRLTMVAERTLTKQRAQVVRAALKAGDINALQRVVDQYADFDWLDSALANDKGKLVESVRSWLDQNESSLLDEVALHDVGGAWLSDVPAELQRWAQDAESFGYRLANSPPVDEAPAMLWRATKDETNKVINLNPWLDFSSEVYNLANPGRFGRMKMQMFRQVRAERIMWTNKRRFVTHVARNLGVAPKVAERVYKNIMWTANERSITVRGLQPGEIYDATLKVLKDEGLRTELTEGQVVKALLVAFQGDLSQVGASQWLTGLAKRKLPGARSNFWGGLAERVYPMVRFTYNPWFTGQEFVEPYILNRMRGISVPIKMGSRGADESLALRNSIDQLLRRQTEDGSIMESAEYQRLMGALRNTARTNLGPSTFFGRISEALPWGNVAERKLLAEALQTKELFGRRMKLAFIEMRGQEFWDNMEIHFKTNDPGDIAMRWMGENVGFVNAAGQHVGNYVDLVSPFSFGKTDYLSRGEGNGLRWHHLSKHLGRGDGVDDGEALFKELRDKTLSHADFIEATGRVGIDPDFAHMAWKLATGPEVDDYWQGYRDTYLHRVKSATGVSAETRKLRDIELRQARAFVQMRAMAIGITEEQYIATRFGDIPRRVGDKVPVNNEVLYDIVPTFRETFMETAVKQAEEALPFTDPVPVSKGVSAYKAQTAARLADPLGHLDVRPNADTLNAEWQADRLARLDNIPKDPARAGAIQYVPTGRAGELELVAYADDGTPMGVLRMENSGWPEVDGAKVNPAHVVSTDNLWAEATEVFVRPEFRRKGVASRLYDDARDRGWDLRSSVGQVGAPDEGAASFVRVQMGKNYGAPVPGYNLEFDTWGTEPSMRPTSGVAGYGGKQTIITVTDDSGNQVGRFQFQQYDAGTGEIQMRSHGSFMNDAYHGKGIAAWVYAEAERRTGLKMFPDEHQLVPGKVLWDRRRGIAFGTPNGVRRALLPELKRENGAAHLFDELAIRDPDALRMEADIPTDVWLPPGLGEAPLKPGFVRGYLVLNGKNAMGKVVGASTSIPLTMGRVLREGVKDRASMTVYPRPIPGSEWVEVHFRPRELGLVDEAEGERWMAGTRQTETYMGVPEAEVSPGRYLHSISPSRLESFSEPWMEPYRLLAASGFDIPTLQRRLAETVDPSESLKIATAKRIKQLELETARVEGTLKLTSRQKMVENAIAAAKKAQPGKAMQNRRVAITNSEGKLEVYGPATGEDVLVQTLDWMTPAEGLLAKRWYTDMQSRFVDIFGEINGPALLGFGLSQARTSPVDGLEHVLRGLEAIIDGRIGVKARNTPQGTFKRLGVLKGKNTNKSLLLNEENIVRGLLALESKGTITIDAGVAAKLSDFVDALANNDSRRWTGRRGMWGPVPVDVWTARDIGFMDAVSFRHVIKQGYAKLLPDGKTYAFNDGVFHFQGGGKKFWLTDEAGNLVDETGAPSKTRVSAMDNNGGLPEGLSYEHGVRVINEATDLFNTYIDPVTGVQGVWGRTDWRTQEVQAVGWMRIQKVMGEKQVDAVNANARLLAVEASPGLASPRDLRWANVVRKLGREENEWAAREFAESMGQALSQGIMKMLGAPTMPGTGVAAGGWVNPLARDGKRSLSSGERAYGYQAPLMWAVTPERADAIAELMSYLSDQTEVWSLTPIARSSFKQGEGHNYYVDVRLPEGAGTGSSPKMLAAMAERIGKEVGAGFTVFQAPDGVWSLRLVDSEGSLTAIVKGEAAKALDPEFPNVLGKGNKVEATRVLLEQRMAYWADQSGLRSDLVTAEAAYASVYKAGPKTKVGANGEQVADWDGYLEDTVARLRGRGINVDAEGLASLRAELDELFDGLVKDHFPDDYRQVVKDTATGDSLAPGSPFADDFAGDAADGFVARLRRLEDDDLEFDDLDELLPDEDAIPEELLFGRRNDRLGDFEPVENDQIVAIWDDNPGELAPLISDWLQMSNREGEELRSAINTLKTAVPDSGQWDREMAIVRRHARSTELVDDFEYLARGARGNINEYAQSPGQKNKSTFVLDQQITESMGGQTAGYPRRHFLDQQLGPEEAARQTDVAARLRQEASEAAAEPDPLAISPMGTIRGDEVPLSLNAADGLGDAGPIGRLHERRGGNVLGYTEPMADGRAIIRGLKNADPITGLHELMHVFARDLEPSGRELIMKAREDVIGAARTDKAARIAALEDRLSKAKSRTTKKKYGAQLAALKHDLGTVKDEAAWGAEHEEFFVEQFFRWVKGGEPKAAELAGPFQHFKNWVESAWETMKRTTDTPGEPLLHPAMEGLFNEMFSKPPVKSVNFNMDQYSLMMAAKQQLAEAQEEAFTTQFFKPGRSFAERSLNHPFLGLYPLSYMWGKVLPEMFRFLALRPFGMTAPMLGWNLFREVSDTVRTQKELDPAFAEFMEENEDGVFVLGSLFPSLPSESPTNAALPLRRIAEQGLENESARMKGEPGKPIDYGKGVQDSVEYIFGPATFLKNMSMIGSSVGDMARSTFGIADEESAAEAQSATPFEFNPTSGGISSPTPPS